VRMRAAEFAPKVTVPVLVVVSPHDRAVRPFHSMRVFKALPGPKQLVEHRGGHSCFRDLDGPFVAQALADWFTGQLEAR
jgi:pimeloyl-ACP methyl ester carboxylesterase